jgi:hypothetical protein
MFAQEPPPDFDVPGRREPGERPELVAEVGLVEVACATGEVAPVDRSGPDGISLHVYSWAGHGIDHSDLPGYGRPVAA